MKLATWNKTLVTKKFDTKNLTLIIRLVTEHHKLVTKIMKLVTKNRGNFRTGLV